MFTVKTTFQTWLQSCNCFCTANSSFSQLQTSFDVLHTYFIHYASYVHYIWCAMTFSPAVRHHLHTMCILQCSSDLTLSWCCAFHASTVCSTLLLVVVILRAHVIGDVSTSQLPDAQCHFQFERSWWMPLTSRIMRRIRLFMENAADTPVLYLSLHASLSTSEYHGECGGHACS